MHSNLKCISCYSTGQPRLSLCENKEIALTHDFNRGNSEKKTNCVTNRFNGFYNIQTFSTSRGKLFFSAASVFAQVMSFAGQVCVITMFCLKN